MMLAGSVFGPGKGMLRTWETTVNGLEGTVAALADGLLLLDEASLFLDGSTGKSSALAHAVNKLVAGSEKARFGAASPREHRILLLSNNNQPLTAVARHLGSERIGALRVRFPTLPADAGAGLGVFDFLPPGCANSAQAIEAVIELASQHHGHAARTFLSRLERELRDPSQRLALQQRLGTWVERFVRRTGLPGNDGEARRVARKFGLVCAAGRLAVRWGVLPLPGISTAVRIVYQRHRASLPASPPPVRRSRTASEEVRAYLQRHCAELHDLDCDDPPDLSDRKLQRAAGFIRTEAGSLYLLLSPQRWRKEFGPRSKGLLDQLYAEGRLWATEGKQRQLKVRQSAPKDRVYCVAIEGL